MKNYKEYNDYMDNISVDAQLHEKIMKQATQVRVPFYKKGLLGAITAIDLREIFNTRNMRIAV